MTHDEDWKRLSARIGGLKAAASALWEGLHHWQNDYSGVTNAWLIPAAKSIIEELCAFQERHGLEIDPAAKTALNDGIRRLKGLKSGGIPGTISVVSGLLALESELSFYLADFDTRARPAIERAFLHLQRSLVADSELRVKWNAAFASSGETACERLGAIHLLLHGIYAYKTSAEGERTDLVLGESLIVDTNLRLATSALVLTEWKLVRKSSEMQAKLEAARKQAQRYGSGILAGFEVERCRFLVLVSKEHLALPDDSVIDNVTYRHINIAVDPSPPSKAPA